MQRRLAVLHQAPQLLVSIDYWPTEQPVTALIMRTQGLSQFTCLWARPSWLGGGRRYSGQSISQPALLQLLERKGFLHLTQHLLLTLELYLVPTWYMLDAYACFIHHLSVTGGKCCNVV